MWSHEFTKNFGDKAFRYRGKDIPVRALDLDSEYLSFFCRHVQNKLNWNISDITYSWIFAQRNVGEKKAKAIANELMKHGVVITDMPVEAEPIRLITVGPAAAECTNCHAVLTTNMDAAQQLYKFCPMCARKFKW